jgi:hypothetical protein
LVVAKVVVQIIVKRRTDSYRVEVRGWNTYICPVNEVASVDKEVDGAVGNNHESVCRLTLVANHRPWGKV